MDMDMDIGSDCVFRGLDGHGNPIKQTDGSNIQKMQGDKIVKYYEEYIDVTKEADLDSVESRGSLEINKKDIYTNEALSGAKFKVIGPNGLNIINATITSNSNGVAKIKKLPLMASGNTKYIIIETKAPDAYQQPPENIGSLSFDEAESVMNQGEYKGFISEVKINGNGKSVVSVASTEMKNKENGIIKIKKKGSDNGSLLGGALFRIYSAADKNNSRQVVTQDKTTEAGKELVFDLLPFGTYEIYEIKAPNGYIKHIVPTDERVKNAVLTRTVNKATVELDFVNDKDEPPTIPVKLVKYDMHSSYSNITSDIKLAGVGFTFKTRIWTYDLGGSPTKTLQNGYSYPKYKWTPHDAWLDSNNEWSFNQSDAATFYTDANGEINLETRTKPTEYSGEIAADEVGKTYGYHKNPSDTSSQEEAIIATEVDNTNYGYTNDVGKIFDLSRENPNNDQELVKISGFVWVEQTSGKQSIIDNKFSGNTDTTLNGIKVELLENGNPTGRETVTSTLGIYAQDGVNGGEYQFTDVDFYKLCQGAYSIRFTYNGLVYQNVVQNLGDDFGSKSVESKRVEFNNQFESVEGNGTQTPNINPGNNPENGGKMSVEYGNISDYKSKPENYNNCEITADTRTAGYELWDYANKMRNEGKPSPEIKYVNLGLYVREQPDIALAVDLEKIDVSINGYNHTYRYNRKLANEGVLDLSASEKIGQNSPDYTRNIYSNYAWSKGSLADDKQLNLIFTYKIVIKNQSASLKIRANEVKLYFDNTLEPVNGLNYSKNGNINFISFKTDNNLNATIDPGKTTTFTIEMKKTQNTLNNWATLGKNYNEKTNVGAEIMSYTTFDSDNNLYAGVDGDSVPGNAVFNDTFNNYNTFEDDTDMAPTLNIKLAEPRTISGKVFEDYTDKSLKTNEERIGDGKNNDGDGKVENVKVELIAIDNTVPNEDSVAYIYPNQSDKELASCYTEAKDSTYKFEGVIPGRYQLKFTYGYIDKDGNKAQSVVYKSIGIQDDATTQNYKSTIITADNLKNKYSNSKWNSVDETWYQPFAKGNEMYSIAVDNYQHRLDINNAINDYSQKFNEKGIIYGTVSEYNNHNMNNDIYVMDATSPIMNIAIEDRDKQTTEMVDDNKLTQEYKNLGFGIVERPRQNFLVSKEISYIKFVLANGQTLLEGDPRYPDINSVQLPYTTYPQNGSLKIEVDKEIMEGATVEVKYDMIVENKSEADYNTEGYYIYGTDKRNLVTTKINAMVDYLDENLKVVEDDENSNLWTKMEGTDLFNSNLINKDVKDALVNNGRHNNFKIKSSSDLLKEIAPNEKTNEINFKANKLLTSTQDTTYNNYAEILSVSNSVGRFYGEQDRNDDKKWKIDTPGNFNLFDESSSTENDNNQDSRGRKAELIIIPPTGTNKETIITIGVLGIVSLVILAGGIIIIKKKVL